MQNTDLLEWIGIPPKIREVLKENEIVVNDEELNRSLFFHGITGAGKTIKAAAILAESLFQHIHIDSIRQMLDIHSPMYIGEREPQFAKWYVFARVPDMLARFKKSFDKQVEEKEFDLIDLYSQARLLVLDDLGVEMSTDWAYLTLYLIIDNRYNEMLPTIFTSNMMPKQLQVLFNDERLVSRIYGMCKNDGIREIRGPDRR